MFGFIIRPLIKKELKKLMKDKIIPGMNIVAAMVEKFGTKFVMGLGGMGLLGWLVSLGELDGLYGGIGIVIIAVTYFWARRNQEKDLICECEPEPEEKPE
jgi:hypothetical protein